jgi:hypothetical protein
MKQFFLLSLLITTLNFGFSQNQLVSYFNSYSEVYGGMEDGGISRTESFHFHVNATITLLDIYVNDKNLILHKGDTLVINIGKFTPYNNTNPRLLEEGQVEKELILNEPPAKELYKVFQKGQVYYATIQFDYIWDGSVQYKYKRKTICAKAKEGFDSGFTGAAP